MGINGIHKPWVFLYIFSKKKKSKIQKNKKGYPFDIRLKKLKYF